MSALHYTRLLWTHDRKKTFSFIISYKLKILILFNQEKVNSEEQTNSEDDICLLKSAIYSTCTLQFPRLFAYLW